ncbi:hypothetical protein PVAP13_8NG335226 [Panicum virgatum]|uniref:Uncharacterized protein n=1 Tax=Panicum virgatum TaxID=38727 RepID=A0A8T0PD07_PANVG|nr:hypothetical protein PVAP13_8NG335226 [Panicum virgatum]
MPAASRPPSALPPARTPRLSSFIHATALRSVVRRPTPVRWSFCQFCVCWRQQRHPDQ